MDFNLTRLPLLSGLILQTPSSALGGFPARWPASFVGLKLPAFIMLCMLLLAVGVDRVVWVWFGHWQRAQSGVARR